MTQQPKSPAADRPALSKEQEDAIFRAAGQRVAAAVRRSGPNPIRDVLAETADTPVYGAFVSLKRGGQSALVLRLHGRVDRRWARRWTMRPIGRPTDDPRFPPISPANCAQLDMDVWILWGPEAGDGPRRGPRAGAFTIGKHGLQIARGNCRGLLLPGVAVDHDFDARTFLQQVCIKAGLPTDAWKDDDTQLLVFEGYAIHGRLPAEAEPTTIRPPAVAGSFYPGDARESRAHGRRAVGRRDAGRSREPWAGRDGAACRLDLLGPAGGRRLQPRDDSRRR